jgi:hypothetical protein
LRTGASFVFDLGHMRSAFDRRVGVAIRSGKLYSHEGSLQTRSGTQPWGAAQGKQEEA